MYAIPIKRIEIVDLIFLRLAAQEESIAVSEIFYLENDLVVYQIFIFTRKIIVFAYLD